MHDTHTHTHIQTYTSTRQALRVKWTLNKQVSQRASTWKYQRRSVLHISHCHTTPPIAFKNSSKHNSMTINIVRLLVFSFLSRFALFPSTYHSILACVRWHLPSLSLLILSLCTYDVYFNFIPLNCLPRSRQLLEFPICVDVRNTQNAAYSTIHAYVYSRYEHMYTHQSTFHTLICLSFYLYLCHCCSLFFDISFEICAEYTAQMDFEWGIH